jgi:hypothetical protein
MGIRSSVGNFINVANEKADQLTSGAKALLCVPSMVAGLPDLGKGLIGAAVSNLTSTLENAVDTVSGIVTNTINGAVSSITGAIDGVLSKIQNAYDEIAGAIDEVKGFKDSLTNKVKDVGEFIAEKDNCDFAAATMLNCITAQAVGSVSDRAAIDIAKGLKPVSDFANDIAGEISGAGGAIDKFVKKQSDQIDKATKIVQKADIF